MKAVITQNCDGLHGKAGTSDDILYELHGNVFVEYCEKCEKSYKRLPFKKFLTFVLIMLSSSSLLFICSNFLIEIIVSIYIVQCALKKSGTSSVVNVVITITLGENVQKKIVRESMIFNSVVLFEKFQ